MFVRQHIYLIIYLSDLGGSGKYSNESFETGAGPKPWPGEEPSRFLSSPSAPASVPRKGERGSALGLWEAQEGGAGGCLYVLCQTAGRASHAAASTLDVCPSHGSPRLWSTPSSRKGESDCLIQMKYCKGSLRMHCDVNSNGVLRV